MYYVLSPLLTKDVVWLIISGNRRGTTFHGVQETLLVYERDENNSLPILFLSIQIKFKIGRVEIDNWRGWVGHKILHSKHSFIDNVPGKPRE